MATEIPKAEALAEKVFGIHNEKEFNRIALEVFHFQFHNNPLYRQYAAVLGKIPGELQNWTQVPFLPVSFFKTQKLMTGESNPELVFRSSGTTGADTSTHYVKSASLYRQSFTKGFELYFGPASGYCILGLLPSYLERNDASLVYMVEDLVRQSGHPDSGFYLYDFDKLDATLQKLENAGQPTILFGVTFALLDFSVAFPQKLQHTRVIETGGMKGRKKEMTREELYAILQANLGVSTIYSEYGMTELLSQAYGRDGLLQLPPWMRVALRDETDPFSIQPEQSGKTGVINVADLANLHSCSFIATDDLGRFRAGGLEVLGRIDNTDIRGCSQMAS